MTTAELVNEVTNYVNSFSMKPEEFVTAMNKEHRTLQQSFTKLCLIWLENCADADYRFDGRNEAAHQMANLLIGEFQLQNDNIKPSNFLPLI